MRTASQRTSTNNALAPRAPMIATAASVVTDVMNAPILARSGAADIASQWSAIDACAITLQHSPPAAVDSTTEELEMTTSSGDVDQERPLMHVDARAVSAQVRVDCVSQYHSLIVAVCGRCARLCGS